MLSDNKYSVYLFIVYKSKFCVQRVCRRSKIFKKLKKLNFVPRLHKPKRRQLQTFYDLSEVDGLGISLVGGTEILILYKIR